MSGEQTPKMLLRHNENEKQADGDPIKTTRSRRDGGRVRGRGQTEAGTEHVVLRRSETHGPHGREVRKKLVTACERFSKIFKYRGFGDAYHAPNLWFRNKYRRK